MGTTNRIDRTVIRPEPTMVGSKGQRRPIVVDGANVGYQFGRCRRFRAKGLQLVYDYFINRGWSNNEIAIFLKSPPKEPEDREICDFLYNIQVLTYTAKRRCGNQVIVVDDDEMILDHAFNTGGIVISQDQYRDAYDKWPQYRELISKRLIQFSFVNQSIVFAKHPLGEGKPHLDEILKF